MRAAHRLGADEEQLAWVRLMARHIGHGHLTAKRGSQDDRTLNTKDIAESPHVVTPLRERPGLLGTSVTAAVTTVVQVDDLGAIGQARVGRLVNRMVEARAAMQEQQRGLFPHDGSIRHEADALNVEEKSHAIHQYAHRPCLHAIGVGLSKRLSTARAFWSAIF